jgi:glutaredoxin
MKIRLFIKPYCGWCSRSMRWLDARGLDYEKIDVMASDAAWEEMVRLSGQDLAPVIEVDGKVLADFGVDELEEFWKKIEVAK